MRRHDVIDSIMQCSNWQKVKFSRSNTIEGEEKWQALEYTEPQLIITVLLIFYILAYMEYVDICIPKSC